MTDGGHLGCKKCCFKHENNKTHLSALEDDPGQKEELKGLKQKQQGQGLCYHI